MRRKEGKLFPETAEKKKMDSAAKIHSFIHGERKTKIYAIETFFLLYRHFSV